MLSSLNLWSIDTSFITSRRKAKAIPKVIAVDELPPDVDALQQALNEKRGSEVQLYVPQRGDKAHLVEMAHTNAVERLARELSLIHISEPTRP